MQPENAPKKDISNTDKPLVSIIMNCYNGEKYLREAIDSVFAQTYMNWEIIFWDNQSVDASANIVQTYSDKRIKYFYAEKHTNLGEARISAVANASGEWIAFLDVDDLWLRNKLEYQIKKGLLDKNCGLLYSDVRVDFYEEKNGCNVLVKSENNYINRKYIADPLKYLFRVAFMPWPSIMVKSEALQAVGGLSGYAFSVDYDLELKITSRYRVEHINEVLCVYRQHADNLSKSTNIIGYTESLNILKEYREYESSAVGLASHYLRLIFTHLKRRNFVKAYAYFQESLTEVSIGNILSALSFLVYHLLYKKVGQL